MVRASLKALYAYRQEKLAAIEFLASHFDIPAKTAAKVYPNAVDILTSDGQISEEKLRQILDMMHDTGRKEPSSIRPNELLDFSFLHTAQKEISSAAGGDKRLR